MWTIKSEGTTSRNEVKTYVKHTIFTDTGQHREKNEDAGIFYNQTQQQMLVLCDGMGGHQAGEIASQFVAYELQKRLKKKI